MITPFKIGKFAVALIAMLFLFGGLFTLWGQETGSFVDSRDDSTYYWVKIGDQTWMSENLAYLPQVDTVSDGSEDIPEGKYYYVFDFAPQPGNDETTQVTNAKATVNYQTYGVLYNWFAAMDGYASSGTNPSRVQGVCPDSWHLPSNDEWSELETWLTDNGYGYEGSGDDIGKALAATSGWTVDGTPGNVGNEQASNNSSGFSALPGGGRYDNGTFGGVDSEGAWWTSTGSATDVLGPGLYSGSAGIIFYGFGNKLGFSVRCVRDIDYLSSLAISGEAGFDNVQELTGDTVQTIYLKNTGSSDLVIDSISSMFQPFSRTVTLDPIPTGDSLAVNISLNTEVLPGSYSDSLVIYLGMQDTTIYIDATISMGAFSIINAGLQEVSNSSVAWGDYDNDGDLDILLTGNTGGGFISGIYRNDTDTLIDINAALSDVAFSSVDWGDYDNDGDLDILLSGDINGGESVSKIYKNDNGTFTDINAALTGVYNSSADWGDYDNDGDLDILLTGSSEGEGYISRVYRNDTGTFVNINAGLTGRCYSSVEWGDYDRDGDLDILLTGDWPGNGPVSKIYQNNNGAFTDINAALTEVYNCSVGWGDWDNDGDLDILLTGGRPFNGPVSIIYQNNNGAFIDINAALTGVNYCSVDWGDYDNDGDLDILLTGDSGSGTVSDVYRNDNGTFTSIDVLFTGVASGSAKWGDYDNDGDLDILLTGDSGDGFYSKLYRNNSPAANSPPATPSGLSMINTGDALEFTWNAATDNETPPEGLNYSLYLIEDNTDTLLMPPADISTGYNRLSERGIVQGTSKQYVNPGKGTYTWGVQAIDAAFAGSPFATASFTIDNQAPGTPQPDSPQPGYTVFEDSVCLDWNAVEYDGDTIYYNIRFGVEGDMQIIADTITEDTLIVRNLILSEIYNWQVVAFDKYGASTTGDLWHFYVANTETEPNNDFSTSNCSNNGTGFYGTVGNGTDAADYFCITYPYNGVFTVTVENLNIYGLANGGLNIVRIYNDQQNAITEISNNSLNAGETASTGTIMLNADETYYFIIEPELIDDNVPYRVSFVIDTFSITDLFELNNTMETAYPLYRDSLYSYSGFWDDSGDWYAVSFTGTGVFNIRITDPDDNYTIHSGLGNVQTFNSNGDALTGNSVNNGESAESSQIGVSAGQTYYIEVPPNDTYSGAAYILEIISDVQEIKDGWSPSIPQPVNIPDGTIEIMPGDTTLIWQSSHPGGEDLTYDLYLGNTNPPPLVAEDLTVNEWEITDLEFGDTIYWRVTVSDQSGNETGSEVYRFNVLREGYFTDSRDGKKYGYLTIGNQMWMAENLAYLPVVSPASDGPDGDSPFYYVYGYYGTDVVAAKATINYATYGVLYNWNASIAGESSSDSNPSNVQGVCPDGWHLPGDGEWTELETWLTDNGYGYEGSGSDIGKALAATSGWTTDDTPGNVGNDQASNNSSGFSALPGGGRYSWGGSYGLSNNAYFWSATESGSSGAWRRGLYYDSSGVYQDVDNKDSGVSVRCTKDIDYLSSLTISGEAGFGNILINSGDTVQIIYIKNGSVREMTVDSIPQLQQPFERTVTVAPIAPGDSLVVNITLHTDNPINTYLDTLTIYIGKQDTAIAVSATLTDNMPVALSLESPADNDYDVDTTGTKLTWNGNDPEGEAITYDVFFGTDAAPSMVSGTQTDTFYLLPTLSSANVYYWYIVAKDPYGNVTTSNTRSFTTWTNDAPVLTLLQPADNSTDIAPDVILKWSATDDENDVMTYDIFLSTDNPPVELQTGYNDTIYIITGLVKNTTYYWKVFVTDSYGNTTESNVFRFTTTNKVTGWIELNVTDATYTGLADVLYSVGSDNLFTGTTETNGKAGPFMLVTGTHPVNVKKAGYFNYFTNSIEVTEDDTTIADIVLPPIGDYNSDGDIDQDDIDSLIIKWRNKDFSYELGPATGLAPDFTVMPDSVLDFEDLMIFGMIWDYYNTSAKSSIIRSSNIETGYGGSNKWSVTCLIEEDITSGMVDFNFVLTGKGNFISNNLVIKYDKTTLQYQSNRVLLTSDYSGVSFVNNYPEKGFLEINTGLLEDNYIQEKEDLVVVSFKKVGDNYNTPVASYEVHSVKSGKEIGIVKFNSTNNITIYPNPASEMVTVDINNSVVPAILKVINSSGRVLILKELTGTVEDIDISGLKSGILIFIVTTDGEVCRKVIVKE